MDKIIKVCEVQKEWQSAFVRDTLKFNDNFDLFIKWRYECIRTEFIYTDEKTSYYLKMK